MISLKQSIHTNRMQHMEKSLEAALDCYTGAIDAISRHAPPITDELVRELRACLAGIRQTLAGNAPAGALRDSLQTLTCAVRDFAGKGGAVLKKKEEDVREILCLVSNTAGAMSAHTDDHQERLRGFVTTLEGITRLNSLAAIRANLSTQVTQMVAYQEMVQKETRGHIDQLRKEVDEFRQRLSVAENLAATDPLTGLANRREGERQMQDRIRSGAPFCVLLFDLDHFKFINDRWGHHWGDHVLKSFASRMAQKGRSEEVVCRWGGDEFLIILHCHLSVAIIRAEQLAERSGGDYHITSGGQNLRMKVQSSVGVAQHQTGETSEQVLARADAVLYAGKSTGAPHRGQDDAQCTRQ